MKSFTDVYTEFFPSQTAVSEMDALNDIFMVIASNLSDLQMGVDADTREKINNLKRLVFSAQDVAMAKFRKGE